MSAPRLSPLLRALVAVGLVLALAACGKAGGASPSATSTGDGAPADGGGGLEVDYAPAGPADEGIEGVEAYRIESHDHTDGEIDYGLRPPPGGPHSPVWANCGFYDEPLPDENVVHDLEHGAVWLAYSPDLSPADVEAIHDLVRANPKTIATPYPGLPDGAAVVVSAWARQLTLESVSDPRLEAFVAQYQDGPQSPEAGVTCTESPLGDPIG